MDNAFHDAKAPEINITINATNARAAFQTEALNERPICLPAHAAPGMHGGGEVIIKGKDGGQKDTVLGSAGSEAGGEPGHFGAHGQAFDGGNSAPQVGNDRGADGGPAGHGGQGGQFMDMPSPYKDAFPSGRDVGNSNPRPSKDAPPMDKDVPNLPKTTPHGGANLNQ
jgi:hypothetical protein